MESPGELRQGLSWIVYLNGRKAIPRRIRSIRDNPNCSALDSVLDEVVAILTQSLEGEEKGPRDHSTTVGDQVKHTGPIKSVRHLHAIPWQQISKRNTVCSIILWQITLCPGIVFQICLLHIYWRLVIVTLKF